MKVHRLERDVFHLVGERYESGTLAVLDGDRALLVDGMAAAPDAARLRELFTLVGHSDLTDVLIDDRPVPYARELWLPLVWFLLPR